MKPLTADELRGYLNTTTTPQSVERGLKIINAHIGLMDSAESGNLVELLQDHAHLLKDMERVSPSKFINAVRFCSIKGHMSARAAWESVFSDKAQEIRTRGVKDGLSSEEINGRIASRAHSYGITKIVQLIDAEMMVPMFIRYSSARDRAVQKQIDLMDGKSAPHLKPQWEKDGREYRRDWNNEKIPVVDSNGKQVYDVWEQKVSPLVQMQAASKVLDMTQMPADREISVKHEHTVSDEAIQASLKAKEMFFNIATAQREAMLAGADITDVQVIGNAIEAANTGMSEEELEEDE